MSIGHRLRRERLRLCLSQETLAEMVGVTARSISRWECDQAFPYPCHQKHLSRIFHTELATLFGIINQKISDLSALVSHKNVPSNRNPFFTDSQQILQGLHKALGQQQTATFAWPYALVGPGGAGKTQIALEYAYHYAHEYTAVFWIAAETHESLLVSFIAIAHLLDLPEEQGQSFHSLLSSVLHWLRTHWDWLLIFDNVEDPEIIKPFLSVSAQGSLLLTTRFQALGGLAQKLNIGGMTPEEGVLFLFRRAKLLSSHAPSLDDVAPEDYSAAAKIVEAFDGLPLALDQAGAYIEETGCSLHGYYTRYCRHAPRLLQRRGERVFEHPQSVMTTFSLAIEQAGRADPAAVDLLRFLASLCPCPVTEDMLVSMAFPPETVLASLCADLCRLDAALTILQNHSLIRRHREKQILTLHRLVLVVVNAITDEEHQRQWVELIAQDVNVTD